jgi:hypothetical protein
VKLGYNKLGYSELPLITNNKWCTFALILVILGDWFPGYNEPRLLRTHFAGPIKFVITEFHCKNFQLVEYNGAVLYEIAVIVISWLIRWDCLLLKVTIKKFLIIIIWLMWSYMFWPKLMILSGAYCSLINDIMTHNYIPIKFYVV